MEMHVTVAQVAECDNAGAGKSRFDLRRCLDNELRHACHGDGNIVLHGGPNRPLGRRDFVAQQPEFLGLALISGDCRILDEPSLERAFEQSLGEIGQVRDFAGVGRQFDQGVPFMRAAQGGARVGHVGQHGFKRVPRHDFEPLEGIAGNLFARAPATGAYRSLCRLRPKGRRARRAPVAGVTTRR